MSFSRALPTLTWAALSCSPRLGKLGFFPGGGAALAMVAPTRNTTARRIKIFFTKFPFVQTLQILVTGELLSYSRSVPYEKRLICMCLVALLTRRRWNAGSRLEHGGIA